VGGEFYGDTIAVQDTSNQQHMARLAGIDAPDRFKRSAISRSRTWAHLFMDVM